MVHWIDVVHWFLDLDHPTTAASIGDHFMRKDVWETPDTVQTLLSYPTAGGAGLFRGDVQQRPQRRDDRVHGHRGDALHRPRPVRGHPGTREEAAGHREADPGQGPKGPDFYDKPDGECCT